MKASAPLDLSRLGIQFALIAGDAVKLKTANSADSSSKQ